MICEVLIKYDVPLFVLQKNGRVDHKKTEAYENALMELPRFDEFRGGHCNILILHYASLAAAHTFHNADIGAIKRVIKKHKVVS